MRLYKPKLLDFIFYPKALFSFKQGDKGSLHRLIILKSARTLWGDRPEVIEGFEEALRELKTSDLIPFSNTRDTPVGNNLNTTFGKWIYCCVRCFKPEVMVETGVSHGYSSWIILNAMNKNGTGRLYSIDLPDHDTNASYNVKGESSVGWLVPEELRGPWQLRLGDAKQLLPDTINELPAIDCFFHDSDHSYEHMTFEFKCVFDKVREGGLILSDDIDKNNSFQELVAAKDLTAVQFTKGGIAIKG
ncbi:MAG: class I SAM-dependent methyltransferase [Roseivirga sp.]|nr:class I SAM-dependent methyltransferase [Roseivirga sp.]